MITNNEIRDDIETNEVAEMDETALSAIQGGVDYSALLASRLELVELGRPTALSIRLGRLQLSDLLTAPRLLNVVPADVLELMTEIDQENPS